MSETTTIAEQIDAVDLAKRFLEQSAAMCYPEAQATVAALDAAIATLKAAHRARVVLSEFVSFGKENYDPIPDELIERGQATIDGLPA